MRGKFLQSEEGPDKILHDSMQVEGGDIVETGKPH
jgi:hypothetical protein